MRISDWSSDVCSSDLVLVVHHADSETPFVDALVTHLRVSGGFIGISGIELVGPIDSDANEEARRRSDALRERYEAALELAAKEPLIHTIRDRKSTRLNSSH